MIFPIRLFINLLLLAGVAALQIFLSSREGKWPGLVLPILSFLFALLYPLNMMAVTTDGAAAISAPVGFFLSVLLVWLIANIPTIVLLAIYFACREKRKKKKQLDKMNIQDLD